MTRRNYCLVLLILGSMALVWFIHYPAGANSPPAGDYLVRFIPLAGGLEEPVGLTHAGNERLFVWERAGRVRIITANGNLLPIPFLDISGRVQSAASWEQGLLGLAFHPDYDQNGVFFVNYTGPDGHTRLSRFQVSDDPDQADAGSEVELMVINQPTPIHNGGTLVFGPDGYLYLGSGDGGWLGDPDNRAQDIGSPLGKILRLDVAVSGPAPAYTIPADNPFVGVSGAVEEIWAYGLRNPWGLAFDRSTGNLFLPDVGNFQAEEVNFVPAGAPGGDNFGWRCFEGELVFNFSTCAPNGNYTFPIYSYLHESDHCAVIGGQIYRGSRTPPMAGHYLFADLCAGEIWSLHPAGNGWSVHWRGRTPAMASAFGAGGDGELYITTYTGEVFRLQGVLATRSYLPVAANIPPQPTPTPVPLPPGPDLTVVDVNVIPAAPREGQPATVLVTVQNVGNLPVGAGHNFYVDFYVNREPEPYLVGQLSWGAQGADFAVGATQTFTGITTFAAGSHLLYAQADTDQTIGEQREDNNTFGPRPLTVTP